MMSKRSMYLNGTEQTFFGPIAKTAEQEKLANELMGLEKEMEDRGRLNYTPAENREFLEGKIKAIEQQHYLENQAMVERIDARMEKLKERHFKQEEKRVSENLLALQRYENKYASMDKESLQKEARYFVENLPDWSPDRLYALNRFISTKDGGSVGAGEPVVNKPFVVWLQELHADEPWRRSDEGRQLAALRKIYNSPMGKTTFVYKESGEIEDPMSIRDIYEN